MTDIVAALKEGDYQLQRTIPGVKLVSADEAARIAGNIAAYGDQLSYLPEDTWNTSIYKWMRGYWDVLVDLYTPTEGSSDLVLFVRVREEKNEYSYEIQSVHVP